MVLDKALYQQAYRAYRQWNEIEAAGRARDAGQLTPSEAWRRYVALVEFCWRLSPEPSQHQRQEKLAALDRYYSSRARIGRSKAGCWNGGLRSHFTRKIKTPVTPDNLHALRLH